MMNKVLLATVLFGAVAAFDFSSSSESCEDDSHGHGGGRPPRPPGGGNNGGGNGGCPAGWRRFNRPNGGWCMKAFGGALTQANADAQCRSYGGVLSGLQNMEEARFVSRSALSVISRPSGSIWIGARRRSACLRQRITSSCTALNSFQWTDGSASGTAGFVWSDRQPDNAYDLTQECVVLTAAADTLKVKNVDWPVAMLDDTPCVLPLTDPSPRTIAGYVCGKAASRR
ncbi:hypothetical protein CAEBREN_11239 [Caenorhabditis brenneri]|uniref:C-type lectin domain-containing protein n=1 Tax=Caenorhabditis brenneri TaxID=135651 RepID=G0MIU7_CAEBE|nr:hypothetical protein CAEBREN_11239 [Caenorhabditis brenneri]